jgi:predicted SnoaL-like aldol condensation-catalyzing enzyme
MEHFTINFETVSMTLDIERMIEMKERQKMNAHLNKEKAVSFLQLVASGKVREAFERHCGPDFHHHNPYFRGDAESLMVAMEENAEKNPNKVFEVKRAIEEGESVAVHSYVRQHPEDLGAVVIHIFRFQDDRIVELWDVGQAIPEDSPNENGVF